MKEMLKSKTIIAFICLVLGVVMVSSPSNKLEDEQIEQEYLVCNLK